MNCFRPFSPCSYKGMALFMTYTAKHYEDQFANGKDCDNVDQPLNGDGLAYATGHSDAMQLRDAQVNVSDLKHRLPHHVCARSHVSGVEHWPRFTCFCDNERRGKRCAYATHRICLHCRLLSSLQIALMA